MSQTIKKIDSDLILEYEPYNGGEWVEEILKDDGDIYIIKTFHLSNKNIISSLDNNGRIFEFRIGEIKGDYYVIDKDILEINYDLLIHKSYDNLDISTFVVNNNVSIFSKFNELVNQQIIIGGDKINSIPINVYENIINSFPTRTELKHYVDAKVTSVLSEYLDGVKDSGNAFEKYLEKRDKLGLTNGVKSLTSMKKYEYEKYQFILEKLKDMLSKADLYNESKWQSEILEIILILFPKYIKCFSNVNIKDYYTKVGTIKNKYIDLMLMDFNGNIDIIEIKRPFSNCIVSKSQYRKNYIPMKELSGAIMQSEKYVFHLNKWGRKGEEIMSKKYGYDIKITNPKGLLILGREQNLTQEQKFDYEIIKRKYANVLDIITYDDLINRLENLIDKFNI